MSALRFCALTILVESKTHSFGLINLYFLVKFILSRTGTTLLLYKDYTYYLHKKSMVGGCRWACSSHGGKGCKAVVHTRDNAVVAHKDVHTHHPRKPWRPTVPFLNSPLGLSFYNRWWTDSFTIRRICHKLSHQILRNIVFLGSEKTDCHFSVNKFV